MQMEEQATSIAPRFYHEWSGSNKTIAEILEEQDRWVASLKDNEIALRLRGNFFGHMEDIWDNTTQHRLVADDFATIKRSQSQGSLYKSCYKHIRNEIRDPDWTSGTANQQGNVQKLDPVGNLGCDGAHLLSHAAVCHRAYSFIAEAAIGVKIEAMALPGKANTNRRKLMVGVKGGFHYTSLKGHKFNKMYWKLQAKYFDSDTPSVLVVPLLPLEQILNWAKDHRHAVQYDVAVFTFSLNRRVVARETLPYAKGTCSIHEITLARENLTTFIKGIASHLVIENVFESLPDKYFTVKNPSLLRWRELVNQLRVNPQILIPTALDSANPNIRIAKARMTTGTSLPDPWLLLAKSAINYTASNGQKLMPTCLLPDDESDMEDDDDYEHSRQANIDGKEVDAVGADFCHDALQRSGFSLGGDVRSE